MNSHDRDVIRRLMDRARRHLAAGNPAAAVELTQQALHQSPDSTPARLIHAQALIGTNQPQEALDTLNAADLYAQQLSREDGSDPTSVEALVARADAVAQLGGLQEARTILERVLEMREGDRAATIRLAAILVELDQPVAAIERLEALAGDLRQDREVTRLLAEAHEAAGQPQQALVMYELLGFAAAGLREERAYPLRRKTRVEPDPVMFLRVAQLSRQAGRLRDAADTYDQLVDQIDQDADLAVEAADLAVELGEDDRAQRYLEAALRSEPKHRRAKAMLAEQHMRCGRFEQAGRLWWQLKRTDDGDATAFAGLVVCGLSTRRYTFADRIQEQFHARFPRAQRRDELGRMWRAAMPGQMLCDLKAGEEDQPAGEDALSMLLSEAQQTLTERQEEQAEHADVHYHMAVCHEAMGDVEEAGRCLEQALTINGGYLAATRRQVALLIRQFHLAEASERIRGFHRIRPDAQELLDFEVAIDMLEGRSEQAVNRLTGPTLERWQQQRTCRDVITLLEDGEWREPARQWRTLCADRLGIHDDPIRTARAA
ncbi:MAG: tetratricopeptide repeat protein [Phycisphaerae bacterium]|nr:tetratricopeptide repeat protein [Phycisphaerae bacterium]